ncbi:MAG: acyl-CoA dehydrogenase family protein [Parasphingopyxis sp.]|uniref:acyl-CoA dehydrogenase family protein n=1 Tax=Parasphingopyxis sp. TaxID=1920299 RepID=UPI003F9F804D
MNFDLSEDQALFRATVERFAAPVDVEARRRIRAMDHGFDGQRWREAAELGLFALAADAQHGGIGGSIVDLVVVAEAMGRGIGVDPWLENGVLPLRLLNAAGMAEEIAPIADGRRIAAFAFAEPERRYNLAPQGTIAETRGPDFILSGEKRFVLGGAMADRLIVTASVDGDTALFLVPADGDGVHRRGYRVVDGSEAAEIRFRDVAAAAEARLDISDETLRTIVAEIQLLAAAEMTGLAGRLLDDTLAYVREREQFGVPIGSFQAVQHRLVDCYAAIEQMRSMLWRAALEPRTDAARWRTAMAGAKALIAEKAEHIAREAVQFHGSMGVTDELAIGHAMKRVMLLARLFGDPAANLAEFAEAA